MTPLIIIAILFSVAWLLALFYMGRERVSLPEKIDRVWVEFYKKYPNE